MLLSANDSRFYQLLNFWLPHDSLNSCAARKLGQLFKHRG
ncbi:Hypothetical protein BFF97_00442 [Corynebacterium pseudotuberculosis]|nr:Hypothetical protein BFF96_0457 [Corynebacterium pseudotuberculosis]ATV79208.1 Hypothetical protein BFF97_00442 [Corynebacterium pseudotuberculosis]